MATSESAILPLVQGVVLLAGVVLAGAPGVAAQSPTPAGPGRFEKNVEAYEAGDKRSPPAPGAILLAGDSQFFRWKTLAEDLPGYTIVNRGVDSFQTSDLVYFADRLVVPYKPRLIVLHVGGNDVHVGKSASQVLADFKAFVAKVRAAQPDVPVAFTSITPSPGRWDEAPVRMEANALVKEYVATQRNLHFIDLWDAFLGPDGKPREDLYGPDRIHPNHEGYLVRVRIMRPLLGPPDGKAER
jgi:lysophospholipase L1-like esterase